MLRTMFTSPGSGYLEVRQAYGKNGDDLQVRYTVIDSLISIP